jgi:Tol biopolymer transport system component
LFIAPVKGINQILSMNGNGTDLKQLTRGTASAYSPSRSPDYRYIAFVRGGMLTVMEAKGEPRARVFTVCPSWTGPGFDWSPDGLSIVFCGSSALAPRGLWEVPVNPNTGVVGTPVLVREGYCLGPSWSPDGTKIAFHLDGVVRVLDLVEGTETSLGCDSVYPTWNATGDKIAFGGVVCYDTPEGVECYYEICTANPDLSGVTPVTSLMSFSRLQTWSPDGTRLVFQSDVSGINSLYMTEVDSGTVTLFYPEAILPNWAP